MSLKRVYLDIIYNTMRIEGVPLSIVETQGLLEEVDNVNMKDIDKVIVINFIQALSYVNSNIDIFDRYKLIDYAKQVNAYINKELDSGAGKIRTGVVRVGDYYPSSVTEYSVRNIVYENLKNILEEPLLYYALATRGQWFSDGNKRTSLLITNLLLQQNNKLEYLAIPIEYKDEYSKKLENYYKTNNIEEFIQYMKRYKKIIPDRREVLRWSSEILNS